MSSEAIANAEMRTPGYCVDLGRTGPNRPPKTEPFVYQAVDNLEVMELAVRYNDAVAVRIAQALGEHQDGVLDHGAGTGTFAVRVSARGYRVRCMEADERLAKRLLEMGFMCEATCEVFRDRSFSGIYSLNVLEHIADDESALRELFRLLHPTGTLVLFVPAFPVLYSSMDRKVGHLRRYTRRELCAKVEKAGFDVLMCSYFDSLGFFASLAYRILGNSRGDLDPSKVIFYDRWLLPLSLFADRVLCRILGKNVFLVARRTVGE